MSPRGPRDEETGSALTVAPACVRHGVVLAGVGSHAVALARAAAALARIAAFLACAVAALARERASSASPIVTVQLAYVSTVRVCVPGPRRTEPVGRVAPLTRNSCRTVLLTSSLSSIEIAVTRGDFVHAQVQ